MFLALAWKLQQFVAASIARHGQRCCPLQMETLPMAHSSAPLRRMRGRSPKKYAKAIDQFMLTW